MAEDLGLIVVWFEKFGIFFAYYSCFAIFAIPFSRGNVRARKYFH